MDDAPLLGSDKWLHRARYAEGLSVPTFSVEQMQVMFDNMASLRVGDLFELVKIVKDLQRRAVNT